MSSAAMVRRWLERSARLVELHATELTALDAAIGDGDHGINLQRGFARVADRLRSGDGLEDPAAPSMSDLLHLCGQTLVSTVGGASGPLYGTFFLQLSAELKGATSLGTAGFGSALEVAVGAVARRGRSTTGEKTMLDALVPGVAAWRAEALTGASLEACARAAHGAADDGRVATAPMIATKGRASYLGERSRGHVDPGAASATLLLEALTESITQLGAGPDLSR
jgi:phosphoenolpyruvate---glycerone phosphotransferase subunit DhaL